MEGNRGFLIITIIYFFFNGFLLPEGMLYTIVLTPFFYYYLVKNGEKNVLGYFIVTLLPIFIWHFSLKIVPWFYLKSTILYFATYLFVYAFYLSLKKGVNLERVYGQILILNFIGFVICLLLYFTSLRPIVWYVKDLTQEISNVSRLRMLTYEPSYYSTLLVPIALYYFLGMILKSYPIRQKVAIMLLLCLPLLFSFSLGVLSSLVFALAVTIFLNFKSLIRKKYIYYSFIGAIALVFVSCLILIVFFPDNLLFLRIEDLVQGKDTSGRGRTFEAWKLSFQMTELRSKWIGCGLGQMKVVGEEVVRVFYNYQHDDIPVIRIPSAIGETISTFGLIGLAARMGLEVYLFFKTKVYTNYYRLAMFSYIFLYQFTGSYLTNIAEYVIWVIAFTPGFRVFDIPKFTIKKRAEI